MRQTKTHSVAEQKPLGVIDVISAGLDLVRRRPWTLLVPVLLDTLIWLLPRLSLAQLFRPLVNEMLSAAALSSDPQTAEQAGQLIEKQIEAFTLQSLVASALNAVTRLPSLFILDTNNVSVPSPFNPLAYSIPIQSPLFVLLLFVPLFLLGLLGVAVYLEWIAQGVRPLEAPVRGIWFTRVAQLWLRMILFSLLFVVLALAASLVLLLSASMLNSPELGALATLFVLVGLFWVLIYFFFVPSALAVSGIGVRESMLRSALLFRVFFWPTLALVGLTLFLDRGLALIWAGLSVSTLGVIIAIFANAYIGTSLLAASMVYYQDRMIAFERLRQQVKRIKK